MAIENTASEKTRQTQIDNQVKNQEENVVALEGVVSRLLGSLETITTPPTPEPTADRPEEDLVPLADTLRNINTRVEHVISTINNLMDRLEL